MQFNRIFVSEDIDSNNLGVITMLQNLGYTQIGHSQYCDEALLKLKRALLDGNPFQLLITDLSFDNPRDKNKPTKRARTHRRHKRSPTRNKGDCFFCGGQPQHHKILIREPKN